MTALEACCIRPLGSCSRPAACWYSRPGDIPFSYVDWVAVDGWPPLVVFGYCEVHSIDLNRHAGTFHGLSLLHCAMSIQEAEIMLVMKT